MMVTQGPTSHVLGGLVGRQYCGARQCHFSQDSAPQVTFILSNPEESFTLETPMQEQHWGTTGYGGLEMGDPVAEFTQLPKSILQVCFDQDSEP